MFLYLKNLYIVLIEQELNRQKEKENIERQKDAERKNQKVIKRQEENNYKIEKDLEKLKNRLKYKEQNTEKLLEKFYEEREKKLNEEKVRNKKRTDHVLKYIKRTEEQHEKNRIQYMNKQFKLEQTVTSRALSRDDNNKRMAKAQEKKYINTVHNRQFLEEESNKRKMEMINRMTSIEDRIKDKKIKNDKENIKRRENLELKDAKILDFKDDEKILYALLCLTL